VKEAPATPPPPAPKPKEDLPPKAEVKKPAMKPPPKPIRSAAVVPPLKKTKEPVRPKEAESPSPPSAPPAAKPESPLSAIPPVGAKIEAGVDAPDFKSPYYLNLIQRKIEIYWLPPPLESTAEIKEAVVNFILYSNGRIEGPTIEKSSGNAFFDQAALRAVYQANPLPPFPQGIRDASLKVHFSFSLMKKG